MIDSSSGAFKPLGQISTHLSLKAINPSIIQEHRQRKQEKQ